MTRHPDICPNSDLVIFDCSGVLVDRELIACRTDAACLTEIGISISAEEIMDRYLGLSTTAMFADLEIRYGRKLPADLGDTLRHRTAAAFRSELKATAGIEAALDMLACKACVASSNGPARLRHSLSVSACFAAWIRTFSVRRRFRAAIRRRIWSCSPPAAWVQRRKRAW
ncbi:hypothetical protein [Virgifigura deserti]|uniref:hypothetical protein n=1 Tax=Virgifigura deserti TaxID=2268457 RepID=UPI003CCBB96D